MINHVKKRVLLGQHDHSPPESSTQFYCIQIQLWWHWYEFSSVLPSSSWHYHTLSLRFQDSITLIIFVIVVVELDCASAKASYLNQKWSGIRIWISRLFICWIATKMMRIHYHVGISHLAECREDWLRNANKSPKNPLFWNGEEVEKWSGFWDRIVN